VNGFLDVLVGLVDVLEGVLLEALRRGIVFFLSYVVVGLVDEFQRPVEAAAPVEASVNRGMIVQILAVIDGGLFDFVDGFIDFVNSFLLLFTQFAAIGALKMGACVAEIRQSVKIRGMLSRWLRLCREERRDEEQKRKNNEHQLVEAFHRTCGSYSNEIDLRTIPSGWGN
jgi:hypothetical protein